MEHRISKRADFEDVAKKYVQTVWKSNKGFFENIFSIATYLSPFLGLGILPLLLSGIGSAFLGYGISDLGKWLDEYLGIGPGEGPPSDWEHRSKRAFDDLINSPKEAHISKRHMVKESGIFSALLKSGKVVGLVIKGLGKIMAMLLGVYGLATIDDFIKEVGAPVRKKVDDAIPNYFPSGPNDGMERKQENNLDTMIDSLEEKYGL